MEARPFGRPLAAAGASLILTAAALGHSAVAQADATYRETTGGVVHTWTNYVNAGGSEGPSIPAYATVQIACKLTGFPVANGNAWWYKIASSPWNSAYYASADPFYNNGQTSGSLHGTPYFDPAVPDCGAPPPPPPPRAGTVRLAQGPTAPSGFRYAITLSGFTANTQVAVSCRDSANPGGFYEFTLATDSSGNAYTHSYCYSADGPDHWVIIDSTVESNHANWSGGDTAGAPQPRRGGSISGTGGSTNASPTSRPPSLQTFKPKRCAGDRAGNIVESLGVAPDPDAPPGRSGYKISVKPGPKGKVSWYANNSKIAAANEDMWNIVKPCIAALPLQLTDEQLTDAYYQLDCHFYLQRFEFASPLGFGEAYDLELWRPRASIPTGNIQLQRFYFNTRCNWT